MIVGCAGVSDFQNKIWTAACKLEKYSDVYVVYLLSNSILSIFCFFGSLMVMFYVKNKVSKASDGYEVAGLLKEKIGNEEGFFEFRMLKVEPYSKYLWNHGQCNFSNLFRLRKYWRKSLLTVQDKTGSPFRLY